MNKIKVEQMRGNNGPVKNQFVIWFDDGVAFQSYSSVIAIKYFDGRTVLDADKWDYSATTGRYRNIFLRETKKETEQNIKSGRYKLDNLN